MTILVKLWHAEHKIAGSLKDENERIQEDMVHQQLNGLLVLNNTCIAINTMSES